MAIAILVYLRPDYRQKRNTIEGRQRFARHCRECERQTLPLSGNLTKRAILPGLRSPFVSNVALSACNLPG
jgi:hypothetical protein